MVSRYVKEHEEWGNAPFTVAEYSVADGKVEDEEADESDEIISRTQRMWVARPERVEIEWEWAANKIDRIAFVLGSRAIRPNHPVGLIDPAAVHGTVLGASKASPGYPVSHMMFTAPNGYVYETWWKPGEHYGTRCLAKLYDRAVERLNKYSMPREYLDEYERYWKAEEKDQKRIKQREYDQAYERDYGRDNPAMYDDNGNYMER